MGLGDGEGSNLVCPYYAPSRLSLEVDTPGLAHCSNCLLKQAMVPGQPQLFYVAAVTEFFV
jgi:hypothetical protein